jgi:hypothetical protein
VRVIRTLCFFMVIFDHHEEYYAVFTSVLVLRTICLLIAIPWKAD